MSDEVLSQEEIEALIAQTGGQPDASAAAAQPSQADEPAEGEPLQQTPVPTMVQGGAQQAVAQAVRPAEFSPVGVGAGMGGRQGVDLILDVQLHVAVELGRTRLLVRDVLSLGPGSVVELDKHAGEPVEVVVNNKVVARGEVVVIDENFGVRITEIVNQSEAETRAKAA